MAAAIPSVVRAGHGYRHPPGFRIDRPATGDWLLLLLVSRARVRDAQGESVVPAGSLVLFAPDTAHRYGSDGGPFANHWLHATGIEGLVRDLALPVDRCWQPGDDRGLGRWFASIERELRGRAPGHALAAGMLAGQLLVEAARTRLPADAGLARLRARVLAEPERPWTVAEIARLAGWSPSHLRARWRAAFATSPIDEVIAARIERAGWLLAEGTGVAETARRCGFADPRYFARIFRRRTGTVPGRVRRAGP